jgi:hypothetical protein
VAATIASREQLLTDEDRLPCFDRVAAALSDGVSHGVTSVVASHPADADLDAAISKLASELKGR